MKAGWRTSEFWLALAANLVGAAMASGVIPEESTTMKALGLAAMALASMGYAVSRGMAKGGAS